MEIVWFKAQAEVVIVAGAHWAVARARKAAMSHVVRPGVTPQSMTRKNGRLKSALREEVSAVLEVRRRSGLR